MSNVKIYGANCQKKEHPLNYQFSYPVMLRYFSILSFIIFLYKSEDSYLDSDVPFCLLSYTCPATLYIVSKVNV
jgi:hypothetical protein